MKIKRKKIQKSSREYGEKQLEEKEYIYKKEFEK